MNAGRDVERLIADWLVAEAPARAPDRILGGAGAHIDRTKQRRFAAAWRDPMTFGLARLAVGAAVILAAIVGAGILGRATAPVASLATPSPTSSAPSPASSSSSVPSPTPGTSGSVALADGSFTSGPRSAAEAIALVNADGKLSSAEKTSVIRDVLGLDGVTTYALTIELHETSWRLLASYDGAAPIVVSDATFTSIDDHTFVLQEDLPSGMSGYRVVPNGGGFTLTIVTPLATEADAIVAKVLFESTHPFVPVP